MKLWKAEKIVTLLLLMYVWTVCGQEPLDPPRNEEAYRLTAGWTFVLANQTLFGNGDLSKNPIFLSAYKIEDFELENENITDNTPIRILTPKEGRSFLGLLDLDRNTYSVVESLDRSNLDTDGVLDRYGSDALIAIQSSTRPTSGERFILKDPISNPNPDGETAM